MAEMCAAMRVDRLFFAHMQPTAHGLHTDIFLSPEEWEDIDREISQLKQAYRMPIDQAAGYLRFGAAVTLPVFAQRRA